MNCFVKTNCWLEVTSKALLNNKHNINRRLNNGTKICCVVKANAYGLGVVEIAKILERDGVDYFGVANICEGISLRNAGIKAPILILGYTNPKFAMDLVKYDLTQTVFSIAFANELVANLKPSDKICCHIKINSGMNRLGFDSRNSNSINEIKQIYEDPHFNVEGIFTHFYNADKTDVNDTKAQFLEFINIVEELNKVGCNFKIRHCCNSSATINYPDMHLDMVRVGAALYGIDVSEKEKFEETIALKARVSQIKFLKKGDKVSYGATFVANKKMKVATITAGYADGIFRSNSNKLEVAINGHHCKVLGTICMDQFIVDVSSIECHENDEVVVLGRGGMSINEVAKLNSTIAYEIICNINSRVARIVK